MLQFQMEFLMERSIFAVAVAPAIDGGRAAQDREGRGGAFTWRHQE